jgi:8-oxo-dGTP diphosphatase
VREEQQVVACVALPDGTGGTREAGTVVRHGEHPRDAASRAAAEQLGVNVVATSLRSVTSQLEDGADGVQLHLLRVVYDARSQPPTPPAAPSAAPGEGVRPGPAKVQRAGAYAVLTHDGRILLTRLSYTKVWTLPGGGIDHGEDPVDAVRREVHEETGLPLTDARLLDVDSVHFTGHAPDGRLEDFHAVRLLFTGTVPLDVEPRVVEVGGSSDAAAWRPIAELDERERRRLAVALTHVS